MCRHFAIFLFLAIIGTTLFFTWQKRKTSPQTETNIVKLLNQALADEWLAYYQYWIGALVVEGPQKDNAISELNEHAQDELRHAKMIAQRIIQLGGTPILEPEDWYSQSGCGYEAPTDPYITKVLEQNIKGEQCAIKFYRNFLTITREKDLKTTKMLESILLDEIKHEQDLKEILRQKN